MIGISSLIVVTSVMNGFEKELENRILGVIPHSVIYSDDPIKNYDQLVNDIKNEKNILEHHIIYLFKDLYLLNIIVKV